MYLEHFDLKAQPFQLTPDSAFLFMSEVHNRAKAYMDYTVGNREGFLVITGEIGCGKTTMIQKLLSELDDSVVVAKIFQTQLDEVEFLQAVLVEFGLNPFNARKVELLDMLNTFLVEQFHQGKQIVLIVDDAHNLGVKVLEEIRMLAGLETQKGKILHIILVGQPQLDETLERPEMEQLLQRVKLRYQIRALSENEVGPYIAHRLAMVGASNQTLFLPSSLPAIYKYSGGVPRLINTLCDTALTCAYADQLHQVTHDVVVTAVRELRWPTFEQRKEWRQVRARAGVVPGSISLQEGPASLPGFAQFVKKMDDQSKLLESIAKSLSLIELHLRRRVQAETSERPPESANKQPRALG